MFGKRGAPGAGASNVEVVVKRKRTLLTGDDATVDGHAPAEAATVRAPRVFRVEGSLETASEQVEGPVMPKASEEPRPRKRRRRVPHGEVTIIRPVAIDLSEIERPSDFGRPHEQSVAVPDFGVAPEDQRRYVKLLTEIARLERQAQAAKQAEAAAAVHWIRKAIAEYAIGADELGLERAVGVKG